MGMSSEWQPPYEWSDEQQQQQVSKKTRPAIAPDVDVSRAANAIRDEEFNEDEDLSISSAFSAALAESPLLRRYDVARARAYDQEYRKWYAAIEVCICGQRSGGLACAVSAVPGLLPYAPPPPHLHPTHHHLTSG